MKAVPQARCIHYKNKPYKIWGFARHSETLEELVLYEALYPNDLGQIWVRPRENFESLLPDGATERFRSDDAANRANPAERQLEAYNRRDMNAFLDCFTDDVTARRLAGNELLFSGKTAMRAYYEAMFRDCVRLHCVVTKRIESGDTIIDEELIDGHPRGDRVRAIAIYSVRYGRISQIVFA
jgi:hypothetical protein